MPTIKLKHKSPEYDDLRKTVKNRVCDMPGCIHNGESKAPKHRGLNDYYYFCHEHIKEYNRAWNFFSGMSEKEIQSHVEKSLYGDRPTWKSAENKRAEEELKRAAEKMYFYGDENKSSHSNHRRPAEDNQTPEHEAMAIMGLSPPLVLSDIKDRYKTLAKKYHPDLNRDNPDAEELLKKINMSYTILKLAFEEYRKLPEHKS